MTIEKVPVRAGVPPTCATGVHSGARRVTFCRGTCGAGNLKNAVLSFSPRRNDGTQGEPLGSFISWRRVVRSWEEDRRGAIRRFLSPLPMKKGPGSFPGLSSLVKETRQDLGGDSPRGESTVPFPTASERRPLVKEGSSLLVRPRGLGGGPLRSLQKNRARNSDCRSSNHVTTSDSSGSESAETENHNS